MGQNRLACIGLTALYLSGIAGAAAQADRQDAFISSIRAMKHSVAPVMCPRTDPAHPQGFNPVIVGSVFFISDRGDFLTADHVLSAFDPGQPLAGCRTNIWFAEPSSIPGQFDAETFVFSIPDCVRDSGLDIARCHTVADLTKVLQRRFKPEPVVIDPARHDDGTPIAITGFPLGTSIPITSRGFIGGYPIDHRGPVQMVIDRSAWPGGSGSPVYDSRGRVVGMVVIAGENFASGISFARTGFALSSFLDAHPLTAR